MSSEAQADPGIIRIGLTSALETAPAKQRRKFARKIELVLAVIVMLALLAIAVIIGLAAYFPAVNAFILRLSHIDIRAEIAYLLHLVQQHL